MKAVLISIRPRHCENIASGKKTVEVRKILPKLETPFKCYIYCTKDEQYKIAPFRFADGWKIKRYDAKTNWANGNTANMGYKLNGKVIGEFVCDCIEKEHVEFTACANIGRLHWCAMSLSELTAYIEKGDYAFYWHISDLKIYDKPKELSEFRVVDENAVKNCKYRERICVNPDFVNGAHIKGGYICAKDKINANWCEKCLSKPITRPPQSWCYVEEIQ